MNLGCINAILLAEFNPLEAVTPKASFSFSIGSYSIVISNHMIMVAMAAVILLVLLPLAIRRAQLVPCGMYNVLEAVCVFVREQVARPCLKEHTDRYISFLWTLFFFILTLNLLGMIPTEHIIYFLTGHKNHIGGAATANIWITGSLAVVTFFMIHIAGIREQGFWHYLANFAPHAPWYIMPILYVLEIISSLVKPFALAIRLFANILAGHTLLATMLGLILIFKSLAVASVSVVAAAAMSVMELFVAILQAYIFTFLTALFMSFSVAPEH